MLMSVALIARDKFSPIVESFSALCQSLPKESEIIIFDSGYPDFLVEKIQSIIIQSSVKASVVKTQEFANTNYVWNQFTSMVDSRILMCLENDVLISKECIEACIEIIEDKLYDVIVPIVYEKEIGCVHFDPNISEIIEIEGGIESRLDRGRVNGHQFSNNRQIKHLERHCFLMSRDTSTKIGELDEQMYCRTDHDLSLTCHVKDVSIGITSKAFIILQPEPDLSIDREFWNYRWNIERVAFAHNRLIEKWSLIGFKKTIDHAYEARKYLD